MGRSPSGVAIGVPGEAHTHAGQPVGHVPRSVGAEHRTPTTTPWGTKQQSSPAAQHAVSQQVEPLAHVWPEQGGVPQWPPPQKGASPVQRTPQLPQLRISFPRLTQLLSQQLRPRVQATVQTAPASEFAPPPDPLVPPAPLPEPAAPPAPPRPPPDPGDPPPSSVPPDPAEPPPSDTPPEPTAPPPERPADPPEAVAFDPELPPELPPARPPAEASRLSSLLNVLPPQSARRAHRAQATLSPSGKCMSTTYHRGFVGSIRPRKRRATPFPMPDAM